MLHNRNNFGVRRAGGGLDENCVVGAGEGSSTARVGVAGEGNMGFAARTGRDRLENPATGRPDSPATGRPENPATGRPENPATGRPDSPATGRPENPATGDAPHAADWVDQATREVSR